MVKKKSVVDASIILVRVSVIVVWLDGERERDDDPLSGLFWCAE
jgi:hypothetical protein